MVRAKEWKKCLFCWSSKSMRLYGREGRSSLACLPMSWANADRWALKERTRYTDNTLICLGCSGKETAASVTKLLLLVMVTCNQGKICWDPLILRCVLYPHGNQHTRQSPWCHFVLICFTWVMQELACTGWNTFILILSHHQSCWIFFRKQCYRYRVFFILIAHTNACSHKVQYKPPFIQPDAFTWIFLFNLHNHLTKIKEV